MDMIDAIAERYSAMVTFEKTTVVVAGGVEVSHWNHNVKELIVDAITEALAEHDARIKKLEASAEFNKEVVEHCERVEAELIQIKHRAEWISVEERLPERETAVLAFGKDWLGVGVCLMSSMSDIDIYGEYCWRWCDDRFPVKNNNVTHWMPFPDPPNLKCDLDRLMKGGE